MVLFYLSFLSVRLFVCTYRAEAALEATLYNHFQRLVYAGVAVGVG